MNEIYLDALHAIQHGNRRRIILKINDTTSPLSNMNLTVVKNERFYIFHSIYI